jgi:hypothetical protein
MGLVAVHERLRSTFDSAVTLVSTLLIFAGTSLIWSMTHEGDALETSAFAVVAIVLLLTARERSPRLPPVLGWTLAAIAPLLLSLLFRGASTNGSSPSSGVNGLSLLFSSTTGLLSLTPIVYIALVGAIVRLARERAEAVAIVTLALWVVVQGSLLPPGTASGPFRHGLTPALALLAPGLAYLVAAARAHPWLAVTPLVAGAIAWNYWMMVQYTVGTLPKDSPVSFAGLVRQQAEMLTRRPYVYPFAFPGNLWFAWRERMPAERFELLAFEPRRDTLDLPMDRGVERFLLEGWEVSAGEGGAPPQWIRERRASLAVPLALPSDRDIDLVITARARLEEPAVNASMTVEINGREVGRFVVPPTAPLEIPVKVPAGDVGRIWRAGYNRLTFVSHGVQRVDPTDSRPPGPIATRSGDRAWPVAIYRVRIVPAS